jgi:hypothetical protein
MPAGTASTVPTDIPNVGRAIARKLRRLDVNELSDLRGRDPDERFEP